MAWDENKKIKFVIDHNKVDDTLHDFPVTMQISNSCGINLVNLTTTSGTTAAGTIFEEATSALSPNYGFTGTDGDAPDWRQWYYSGINCMTYCSIQNNKFNYSCDTAADCWNYSNYELVGDFDIQIDFDLVTHPETNSWEMSLLLNSTGFTAYLIREYAGSNNRYRTSYSRLGVGAGGTTTNRDDLSGKLRHVRIGGTITTYYWNAGWVLLSTSGFSDCTEPVRLALRLYHSGGPGTVEYNLDNVQLNSGSVKWDYLRSKIAVYAGGDQNTGTRCFIDQDHYDTLNEEIALHVAVPEISHTEDTELQLYYDEDNNTNTTGYPFSWWASLTPEEASDDFSVDGVPNEALWYRVNDVFTVSSGTLAMDLSASNPSDECRSTYTIYGDFDVQVDWDLSSTPTTDGWRIGLNALLGNTDLTYKSWFIRRRYSAANSHNYNSGYHDGGGWTSVNTATTSGSGKFRLTREDHVIKSYYYEDGSWQLNQTTTLTNLDNVPFRIFLDAYTTVGQPSYSAYFSNFTVNKAFIITDNYVAGDTFAGPDYSQPNREKWRPYPGGTNKFVIKDNSLYINDTGATSGQIFNTHWVDGDFDFQVDFDLVTWPSTDVGYTYMRFWGRDNNDDFMTGYIGRRYEVSRGGNVYFTSFYDNSGWTGETNTATSDLTGKFRFYRDGNTIYAQYWNGASWVTTDSEDFDSAPEVMMYLQAGSSGSNTGVEVKFDNFKVNSARRVRGYTGTSSGPASVQVWDQRYQFVCHFAWFDYPLGGYANRVYDGAYRQHRGTAQSNMTYSDKVDGKVGQAFDFDGTDDYVDFGTFNPSNNDLTIEFLWNLDQLASDLGHSHHPIVKRDAWSNPGMMWQIHINNANDKLAFTNYTDWTGSADGEFDTLIQRPGEWQNVAIVHDSSGLDYMYVDGLPVESHTALTFDAGTSAAVVLAAQSGGGGATDGKISEVRISNIVRTPTWIKSTYYSLFDDLLYIDWLQGPQGFDSTKYIQFFVDHSNIDNTLSNFPIRFRISNQSGIDNIDITRVFDELTVSGTSYDNRKKIAVTTADQTTQCYVEIENWDHSRQEANLWIKVPSLSPQQQTEFYLYYDSTADDNTDWVGDTGDVAAQNVWDDNFAAVYHMAQDPAGGASSILDSTSNAKHGTPNNMETGDLIDGQVGEALAFGGTDESVQLADSILTTPTRLTVEMLAKADDTLAEYRAFAHNADEPYISFRYNQGATADRLQINILDDVSEKTLVATTYTLTDYHYVAVTADENNSSELQIDDNVDVDTESSTANFIQAGSDFNNVIGASRSMTDGFFIGTVDETRISSSLRSEAWRKATYYTLVDDMIYYRMPWDDTHSEILLTVSGSLIDEDLTNFPLTLTLASGVGTNTEDVTKIFDGLTLSGTLGYSDDFTGWDGDEPDPLIWIGLGDRYGAPWNNPDGIYSNKLRMIIGNTVEQYQGVELKEYITGDFDVQVDYELISPPNVSSWKYKISMSETGTTNDWCALERNYSVGNDRIQAYVADNGVGGAYDVSEAVGTAPDSGKLRIAWDAASTIMHFYYWTGAAWDEVGSGYTWASIGSNAEFNINLSANYWDTGPTSLTGYFDNFTVSGTLTQNSTRKKIAIFSGGDQYTGDKCFTEIEYWDAVNETATLHVQVPTLTSGTDTDLYFYEDIDQPDQDYRLTSEANDTFTAASGTAPDATRWAGSSRIYNNKLRFDRAAGETSLTSRFLIEGDFDIEIPVDFVSDPEVLSWFFYFMVRDPDTNYYTRFEYGMFSQEPGPAQQLGTRFRWWAGGGFNDTDAEDGAQTTGKWRLARIDDTVSGYYDYNGGWTKLDDDTGGAVGTNPVEVLMGLAYWTGTPDAIIDVDNFTVTSDTVTGFVDDTGGRPAQEVWDSSFKGVWHMAQEPTGADTILDSTSNVIDMTSNNMEVADLVDGQVGKALSFGGTDEYLTEPDNNYLDTSVGFTAEVLFNLNSAFDYLEANDQGILSRYHGTYAYGDWLIRLESDTGKLKTGWVNAGVAWQELDSVKDSWDADTWYYIANTSDSAGTEITIQKSLDNSDGLDRSARDSDDEFIIGAKVGYVGLFEGEIDEVRISSTARSTAWRGTTYDSLFDDLVFYDLLDAIPPEPEPPTPSGLADAMGWTSINDVLTSGIVVRLYRRSDGSLVGEDISATLSGIWNIPTTYDEYHYAIGLYPVSGTNSLIYDWLHPTLNP